MIKLLLWLILFILCWPLALLVLVLWPLIWLICLPFRVLGIGTLPSIGAASVSFIANSRPSRGSWRHFSTEFFKSFEWPRHVQVHWSSRLPMAGPCRKVAPAHRVIAIIADMACLSNGRRLRIWCRRIAGQQKRWRKAIRHL